MRKSFIISCLLCAGGIHATNLMAQNVNLIANPSQVVMGDVYETTGDSALVWVKNPNMSDVVIKEVRTYDDHFGHAPYSISLATPFTIPANDSIALYVKFKPTHNLAHNTEIALVPAAPMGALTIDLRAQGKYSNPYYNSTQNLREQALKDALNLKLTQTLSGLSYNLARDKMFMEIDNQKFNGQGATQNTLECIYTGRQAVGYTSRTDCQTNYSFNTEHTFPQSLFSSNLPMLADLHHIFPTDDNANSIRGNNPFWDIQGSGTWTQGGSVSNGSQFEPRDAQKGRTARALMYFCIKYQDYSCFVQGQESILHQWHKDFPPDNIEKLRNQAIATAQGNRNPFIDYPQFLERIHKITTCGGNSFGSNAIGIDRPKDTIDYGTIPINTLQQHSFVIINTGEDTIHLTNFAVGDPAIEFDDPTLSAVSIAPDEAYHLLVDLTVPSLGAFQSYIRFDPGIIAAPYLEIPVIANGINNVGNDGISPVLAWKMYPNPSQAQLNVLNLAGGTLEIVDMQGRSLQIHTLHHSKEIIDIQALPSGLYFVKGTLGNQMSVQKLWKN